MSEAALNNDQSIQEQPKNTRYRKSTKYLGAYEWLSSLVVTIFIVILIFTFIARLVGVEGSSMVETLHDKDRLVITNLFYTPTQGDIVVVSRDYLDGSSDKEPIIKRVIALEGQTIDLKSDNGGGLHVYVDGVQLQEDYINGIMYPYGIASVKFPYTVPEGRTFVMGDNRNNSLDSRSADLGAIDNRYILGKVILRVFPIDKFGAVR